MDWLHKKAFWMSLASIVDIVLKGVPPLNLESSIKDGIKYIKAYGGLLQGGVPSGYTAVEYIEATGTQYIETGLSGAMRWVGAGQGTSDSAGSKCILAARASKDGQPFGAVIFLASRYGSLDVGKYWTLGGQSGNVGISSVATSSYAEYDVTFNDDMFSGTINQESFNNISNDYTIGEWRIGCATTNTGVKAYLFVGNIYRQQAYQNGVLVGDFIPAKRNSDSVIGMFDTVSNTFFTNQGSGTFTAGNEIAPTPSNPIDLVCNNGALKILDKSSWTIFTNPTSVAGQGVYISTDGKWYNANDRGAGCAIPLTIGEQYTLVIHKKTAELGTILRYGQSPQETPTGAGIQLTDWYRGDITDGQMISFVAKQPYLVMQLSAAAVEAGMIQEAIEVLEAQGDNETLAITTKNLCNVATDIDGYYIAEDGTITASANSCYSAVIPVVAGKTYTWSGICGGSSYNNKRVHAYIDGVWNQQVAYEQVTAQTPFTITFTVPAGCNGIRISHFNDDTETQVEVGATKTNYIAYNDSTAGVANLLKIDNYVDTQEILTGLITHKLGIYVFDGTEDWTWSSGANAPARLNIPEVDYVLNTDVAPVMCSHFMPTFWNNLSPTTKATPYVAINRTNQPTAKKIVFTTAWDANITDAESWKTFLAAQYAAGTPVIVVYPLATEYAEPAPIAQAMNVVAGDNVLDIVQAGMSGLEVEAKYTKGG